jgi:SAM-dependent methyltransferase
MRPLLAAEDRNRGISAEKFSYHRCPGCGVISLSPVPDELGRYYPSDYIDLRDDTAARARRAEAEQYKLDLVLRVAEGGKLLEIGPGAGGFLDLAQSAGFEVEAVEQNEACCSFLEATVGAHTYCTADPVAVVRQAGPWNVVALWHSLEHLNDPGRVLAAAADALAPGGSVFVATPNPESLQFRLLRSRWTHLDAPRHLHLIPPAALREHSAQSGLRRCTLLFADEGTRNWNAFGWRNSMPNAMPLALAKPSTVVGRVTGRLLKPVERRGTRGSTYTAILQR